MAMTEQQFLIDQNSSQAMEKHLVFVYGTLRKGFINHYFLRNSTFLGGGKTKEKYALYADVVPYVLKNESISHIRGELYEVDRETLEELDDLEEHPDLYKREKITIILDKDKKFDAWIYFFPQKRGILLENGDYSTMGHFLSQS